MELHAGADLEINRVIALPSPFGRERGHIAEGVRVAMHQPIHRLMRDDDAGALAVEIRVNIRHRITEGDPQRIGAALRHHRPGANAAKCQATGGSGHTLPKATSADLHLNCSVLKGLRLETRVGRPQAPQTLNPPWRRKPLLPRPIW